MPSFDYVAWDTKACLKVLNSLDAVTEEAAIKTLLDREMLVISIQQKADKKRVSIGGSVPLKDLMIFTSQFATMFDAGMSVISCLSSLARQTRNKVLRDVIEDLIARIKRGESLSDALSEHPKVFDKQYLCMVQAGEKSGMLADVLHRVGNQLEKTAKLRHKVKSAMMYPSIVTVVALSITVFLLVKVVPVFKEIFDSFQGQLPAPTLFIIDLSNFVKDWFIVLVLSGILLVFGWLYFIKTPAGRHFWDSYRIRLPLFGQIAHSICLARFAMTFSSLVRSGVPILEVLRIVADACGNTVMERAVNKAANDIEHGETISDALAKHPVFPDMIVRMMATGEQTGKIDVMMERIAKFLESEVETSIAGLTTLIEPVLIVFLGVVVGGIVICMFLPIFKLSGLVAH
jgi:type IV pilus assembly protein PilC